MLISTISTGSNSLFSRFTRYSDSLHDFSVTITRCSNDVYVKSLFLCTARLWNSLPIECIPLTYDLKDFKCRTNRDQTSMVVLSL